MDDYARIEGTFGISSKELRRSIYTFEEKDGFLIMHIKVDRSIYKNRISSYSEILMSYFARDHIFVLSRIKERKGLAGILAILFHNSKASVMSEMKSFAPNYLVKRKNTNLLVSQDDEDLTVFELPIIEDKIFTFRGYRYKIANELKLK